MNDIQGQEPTSEDDLWLEAAGDLAPDKSLQRISDKVGFIFTNLTLAGTALAGAGIVVGLNSEVNANPALLTAVLTLVFASVAAALMANLPSMQSEINPSDTQAIRRFFERTIRWKGWFARAALILFAAALVAAFVVVTMAIGAPHAPTLSMQWTRLGSGRIADVRVTAQAERLSGDSTCEASLTAYRADLTAVVLMRDVSGADSGGQVQFTADVEAVASFRSLVLTVIIERRGRLVESRSLKLNL